MDTAAHERRDEPFRAQTIELFFDLVFVFAITRITHVVEAAQSAFDLAYAAAVLMLIWWMYGGYIWLTNHAHTPRGMRLVLIAAMIGFMVMALTLGGTDLSQRLSFGLAYLFIVLLHFAAFVWQGGPRAGRAMLRFLPFNALAALMVVSAGAIGGGSAMLLLVAPAGLYMIASLRNTGEGFALDAGHFVERHGLLLIIVLGEVVIGIGTALAARPFDWAAVFDLIVGVALVAALWWSYFDGDDLRAEQAMLSADNKRRTRIAMFGYNGGHLLMVAGLIGIAAGLRASLGAAGFHGDAPHGMAGLAAAMLPAGTALYFCGDLLFRLMVGIRPVAPRLGAAAALAALCVLAPAGTPLVLASLAVSVVVPAAEAFLARLRRSR